jgi:hypothetical protein
MRYLEKTTADALVQNELMWTAYEARERIARGLSEEDSLDIRNGVRVPLAEAITRGPVYVQPIVSEDRTLSALPLDDTALELQGRDGVDLTGHKDSAELDPKLRERISDSEVERSGLESDQEEPR